MNNNERKTSKKRMIAIFLSASLAVGTGITSLVACYNTNDKTNTEITTENIMEEVTSGASAESNATNENPSENVTNTSESENGSNTETVAENGNGGVNSGNNTSSGQGSGSAGNNNKPTTEAPSTQRPTTQKPTTEEPSTQRPTTQKPTTEAPTTEAPHVHTWVEVTQTIHHEAVKEKRYVCNGCGHWSKNNDEAVDHEEAHTLAWEPGGYSLKTVTIQEAYDETVVTGYRCTGCGATKAK